jgi:hypothetical protein
MFSYFTVVGIPGHEGTIFHLFITELQQKNENIDVIALQETWEILYPDQLMLPDFQKIVYKNRKGMRGGGGLLCKKWSEL